jgi:hypothetical protein
MIKWHWCAWCCGDVESVEPFRKQLNEIIIQSGLCYSQTSNSDETGLFWCGLPENTQASHVDQSTPGQKKSFCFTNLDCCLIQMTYPPN